jgi:hypothetical protein
LLRANFEEAYDLPTSLGGKGFIRIAVPPRTKLIKDLDQMRTLAFPPPLALVGLLEDADARGEGWWVLMAYGSLSGEVRWVAVFPETKKSLFFADGDELEGRWDSDHQVFLPEDGSPLNLLGNPVSLSSVEEADEEADEWSGSP